jgi:hypothetical protein
MSVLAAIRRFLIELDEAMEHARTGRLPERLARAREDDIRRLPPELRKDLGRPDRCTARMSVRGRDRACHENW